MKSRLIFTFVIILSLFVSSIPARSLERLFSRKTTIRYNGYKISRRFDKKDEWYVTTITRRQNQFARVESLIDEDSRFALYPILGKRKKQLIIQSYSGGAHCCTSYFIYDLSSSRIRTLFNGNDYGSDDVGYEMDLIDINKDGVYEFVQSVMNFDYFPISHAGSPFPEVVFAYNRKAKKYLPANRKFSAYLLRDIKGKKSRVDSFLAALPKIDIKKNYRFSYDYSEAVLGVTLTYIYAGKKKEGWDYFDKNYKLTHDEYFDLTYNGSLEKEQIRDRMKKLLEESVIYHSIYK